jgi:hypothetical protein
VFSGKVYDNGGEIFKSLKETYPSSFDPYQKSFSAINYDDLCINFYGGGSNDEKG